MRRVGGEKYEPVHSWGGVGRLRGGERNDTTARPGSTSGHCISATASAPSDKGQLQLPSLRPTHNPTSAPMPLNNTDAYENASACHSSGTNPPIVEPTNIPSQTDMRQDSTKRAASAHALRRLVVMAGRASHHDLNS
jgi:hypothetical protein